MEGARTSVEPISPVFPRGLGPRKARDALRAFPPEFTMTAHNNPLLERFFRLSMVVLLNIRANCSLFIEITTSGTPGRVDRDGIDIPRFCFFAMVSTALLLTSHVAVALAYALGVCAYASLSTLHWLPNKPVARRALGGSA